MMLKSLLLAVSVLLPTTTFSTVVPKITASDMRPSKYDAKILDDWARTTELNYGLPKNILVAIKNAGERSWSNQVSSKGARGVMQFMPATLTYYGGMFNHNVTDPFASIDAAGKYIKVLLKENKGHTIAAIASYNGGPKASLAVRLGKEPPALETRNYLHRVSKYLINN